MFAAHYESKWPKRFYVNAARVEEPTVRVR